MSNILLDRGLLQRLLERYFELEVDNRAYRALVSRASVTNPGPALQYAEVYGKEVEAQRVQFAGNRSILLGTLASEDGAAFQRRLSALLPHR